MMRVLLSSALAAVLTSSVSGSIFSTQGTSCDPVAISDDTTISSDDFAKKVDLATNEACTAWSKAKGLRGSFDSAPFKLSYTGAIGGMDAAGCASALKSIIDNCRSGALYYGGSGKAQGVDYRIERAENEAGSIVHLEARGPRGRKKTGTGSNTAAEEKKAKAAKNKEEGEKKKATISDEEKKAQRKKAKEEKAAKKKAGAERKKKLADEKKKKEENGPACKIKKKKKGGKRELTGRAILLNLMRQSAASPLFKRGDKTVKMCTATLNLGPYLSGGSLKKKNPDVILFGFPENNNLKWQADAWKHIKKSDDVKQGDTEHELEAQTVAGFAKHLETKAKLTKFCSTIKEFIPVGGSTLSITTKGNKKHKGTISALLAEIYPTKDNDYKDEFVIFDHAPNAVMKQGIFSGNTIMAKFDPSKTDEALWDLLDLLAVAKYFKNKKVRDAFEAQSKRVGIRWGEIGKAEELVCEYEALGKKDLNKLWTSYIKNKWVEATNTAKKTMNDKFDEMEEYLKCDEVDERLKNAGDSPSKADAAKREQCVVLNFIKEQWSEHKSALDEAPLPESENEDDGEDDDGAGGKKRPHPQTGNSDAQLKTKPKTDDTAGKR